MFILTRLSLFFLFRELNREQSSQVTEVAYILGCSEHDNEALAGAEVKVEHRESHDTSRRSSPNSLTGQTLLTTLWPQLIGASRAISKKKKKLDCHFATGNNSRYFSKNYLRLQPTPGCYKSDLSLREECSASVFVVKCKSVSVLACSPNRLPRQARRSLPASFGKYGGFNRDRGNQNFNSKILSSGRKGKLLARRMCKGNKFHLQSRSSAC